MARTPLNPARAVQYAGALRSAALGLDLRLIDGRLQLFDAATGERLLRTRERDAALTRSAAEVARLREELAGLRGAGEGT